MVRLPWTPGVMTSIWTSSSVSSSRMQVDFLTRFVSICQRIFCTKHLLSVHHLVPWLVEAVPTLTIYWAKVSSFEKFMTVNLDHWNCRHLMVRFVNSVPHGGYLEPPSGSSRMVKLIFNALPRQCKLADTLAVRLLRIARTMFYLAVPTLTICVTGARVRQLLAVNPDSLEL